MTTGPWKHAGWSRLTGDAARSPITAQGSKNQYSASFGVIRRFDIGFEIMPVSFRDRQTS